METSCRPARRHGCHGLPGGGRPHRRHPLGRARRIAGEGRCPRRARVSRVAHKLVTERLVLREWEAGDAPAAIGAYGDEQVARWLSPAMDRVGDTDAMRALLERWVADDA